MYRAIAGLADIQVKSELAGFQVLAVTQDFQDQASADIQATQEFRVGQAIAGLADIRGFQGFRVLAVIQEYQDLAVIRASADLVAIAVYQVLAVTREFQVGQGIQEFRGIRALADIADSKAHPLM